jgi:Transcriptional Coactivator p15 (PC4)
MNRVQHKIHIGFGYFIVPSTDGHFINVALREYKKNVKGDYYPTKNGVSLMLQQYDRLVVEQLVLAEAFAERSLHLGRSTIYDLANGVSVWVESKFGLYNNKPRLVICKQYKSTTNDNADVMIEEVRFNISKLQFDRWLEKIDEIDSAIKDCQAYVEQVKSQQQTTVDLDDPTMMEE